MLSLAIIGFDRAQREQIRTHVDTSTFGRVTDEHNALPVSPSEVSIRKLFASHTNVALVDMSGDLASGIRAIELIREHAPDVTVFASGDARKPETILAAMRAGASEFLQLPPSGTALVEALSRLLAAKRKTAGTGTRGQLVLVANAKGGNGATTVAVNLATALQATARRAAFLDLTVIGHASLQMNIQPKYSFLDVARNLHRMDGMLLESMMTTGPRGLHVLGATGPGMTGEFSDAELAKLFDVLVGSYRFVIVDSSDRLDRVTQLVANIADRVLIVSEPDLCSLWAAVQCRAFLAIGSERSPFRLVLNRYRKRSDMPEQEIDSTTGLSVYWKIPNHYPSVSAAIEKGVPLVMSSHSDVGRAIEELASHLQHDAASVPKLVEPVKMARAV